MLHEKRAIKNKKHPKVHFWQFLSDSNELLDDASKDKPRALGAVLLEEMYIKRRELRHLSQTIRNG